MLFSPFLILYLLIVLFAKNDPLQFDGSSYWRFANNLLQGFYSPPAPHINLVEGPGYPIFLMLFAALGVPLKIVTICNAIMHYLAIVFLFKSLKFIVPHSKALVFSVLFACCYSSYVWMTKFYTETFVLFLFSLHIFFMMKAYYSGKTKYYLIAGFFLGYISLTKVVFPYVLLTLIFAMGFFYLLSKNKAYIRKGYLIIVTAFAVLLPYLIYSYNLTDRFFYIGTSGGDALYWMSTPFEYEYGAYNNEAFDANGEGPSLEISISRFKENHQRDIDSISSLVGLAKDDAYKKIAMENIRNHPVKYLKNVYANISRLMFNFPQSYMFQVPLKSIWYFAIIYSLMLISMILTIFNWRKVEFHIMFIFLTIFIYLGGSSFLTADSRMFLVMLPSLLLWIGYILEKSVKINVFWKNDVNKLDE
jgi:hypothetical protein